MMAQMKKKTFIELKIMINKKKKQKTNAAAVPMNSLSAYNFSLKITHELSMQSVVKNKICKYNSLVSKGFKSIAWAGMLAVIFFGVSLI